MNSELIAAAARVAVARNVNNHVVAARASLGSNSLVLTLNYYIDRRPQEDDIEEREIALSELLGEFPWIEEYGGDCIEWDGGNFPDGLMDVVYLRDDLVNTGTMAS